MLDVHCTTGKRHDTQIGWQLARVAAGEIVSIAADKGYDWQQSREKLREEIKDILESNIRQSRRTSCMADRISLETDR